MRTATLKTCAIVLMMALVPVLTAAQEPAEKKPTKPEEKPPRPLAIYRVDFALYEVEDSKRLNTRKYTLLLEVDGNGRIRTENDVSVKAETGFLRYEIGVNLDCELRERENQVLLQIALEIKDFALPDAEQKQMGINIPVRRYVRSQVSTAIPPAKPTIVSAVDESVTKRRYELEVTAVKIK